MNNKMNIAILWRQKKCVQDSCSIYIYKIPNSWLKLSPLLLRKNEEQHLKHSEGNLPKPLTNRKFPI